MIRLSLLISSLVLLTAVACGPKPSCTPESTRCVGDTVEICNANGSYEPVTDCGEVSELSGTPFVCGYTEEQTADGVVKGHTCVLPDAQGEGGALP